MTILMLIIRSTLLILVVTCCSALIPVIYGGPVHQIKHEAASEFQSLLSKGWRSMDLKQNLESADRRESLLMLPKRQQEAADAPADAPAAKRPHKKPTKLRKRIKKHRHELKTPAFNSPITPVSSVIAPDTEMTASPPVPKAAPTLVTTDAPPTSSRTTSVAHTTTTTTTTTSRRRQQHSTASRTVANVKRDRQSSLNSIKLRSKCFPGHVSISEEGVAAKVFSDVDDSEAYLKAISVGSTIKNETIVALRGDKSGYHLCLEKKEGFVAKFFNSSASSLPPECRFIEKHLNGVYVRYVSLQRPRRFLGFDRQGKPIAWMKRHHRIHSKNCTNFLLIFPKKKGNNLSKIIRDHLMTAAPAPPPQRQPSKASSPRF